MYLNTFKIYYSFASIIRRHTYCHMLIVLTQFRRAGNHLPLSNPLLQLVHLSVELVEPVLLLQTTLPLLHQVLQGHVQTVDLRLALADLLAVVERSRESVSGQVQQKKNPTKKQGELWR